MARETKKTQNNPEMRHGELKYTGKDTEHRHFSDISINYL